MFHDSAGSTTTFRTYLILLVLYSFTAATSNSQPQWRDTTHLQYLTAEKVLLFAEWLYRVEKDYERAAGEYSRYLFTTGLPNDSVAFRIARSLKKNNQVDEAIRRFEEFSPVDWKNPWYVRSKFHQSHALFLSADYDGSRALTRKVSEQTSGSERLRSLRLEILGAFVQKEWAHAESLYQSVLTAGERFLEYNVLLEEGKGLSAKSPLLAGTLSAVVPGLGKVYSSEWEDGVYAFIYTILSVWQAYDGFHDSGARSVKGWVFGTLSSLLYLGNIYGAVESVKRYNFEMDNRFLQRVRLAADALGESE